MRRCLWLFAAVSMSGLCLYAQEAAAPGEPLAPEIAGSSSETPTEAPEQAPESGSIAEAVNAPADPPSAPESEADPAPAASSSTDSAPSSEPAAPNARSAKPAFDSTDNAEWESRYAGDRVPAATKPSGFRPHDRGVGWFQQSRERVRRRRSALWERVAEVRGRGPLLRSRGRESPRGEGERSSGSTGTSEKAVEGQAGRPTPP